MPGGIHWGSSEARKIYPRILLVLEPKFGTIAADGPSAPTRRGNLCLERQSHASAGRRFLLPVGGYGCDPLDGSEALRVALIADKT